MNISAINSYNYTSFTAKKHSHTKGKYVQPPKHPVAKAAAAVGITGAMMAAIVGVNRNDTQVKPEDFATIPTTSITETYEIEPTETQAVVADLNAYYESMAIPVKPKTEWITMPEHNIIEDERLVDIIINNAQLDKNTQYQDLIPYIERLMSENPYLIKRVIRYDVNGNLALPEYTLIYNKQMPGKLCVDSILPVNRLEKEDITEETLPEEPVETEPVRETSAEDTVVINENEFNFDIGTMKKVFGGKYEGLMFDKFATLDKKANGKVELVKYAGLDSDSNIAQKLTYDKEGRVVEISEFANNKVETLKTYEYNSDTLVETVFNKTAKGSEVDKIVTVYDRSDDFVYSKEYFVNGKVVAALDFENQQFQVGKNGTVVFDFEELLDMIQ